MVVEHAVHPASTARIRLALEHTLVRGSHDRLRLFPRHRASGPRGSGGALTSPLVRAALASPLVEAPRVLRTSVLIAPVLIALPGLVPAVIVMDIASGAFPVAGVVLVALVVRRHPIRIGIRGVRPVAVVPPILTVRRGVPIAFDPLVVGSGLRRDAVRARRRRRLAHTDVERNL